MLNKQMSLGTSCKKISIMLLVFFSVFISSAATTHAKSIGDGTEIEINTLKYTYNVKYVDQDGIEFDASLNYGETKEYRTETAEIAQTLEPQIKEIENYTFKGYYYYDDANHVNEQGSLENLLQGASPVVKAKSDLSDYTDTSGVVNYTVYMVYEDVTPVISNYTVTYNGNGGAGDIPEKSVHPEGTSVDIKPATLTRKNYTFVGWNSEADGSGTDYLPGKTFVISSDITLYAKWQENDQYTVQYISTDHTSGEAPVDTLSPYYVDNEATVLGKGSLERTGYIFAGWNTEANGKGETFKKGDVITVTEDVTLYAQWVKLGVTPDPDPEPTPDPDPIPVPDPDPTPDPEPKPDPKPQPEKPKDKDDIINVEVEGSNNSVNKTKSPSTGDTSSYMMWGVLVAVSGIAYVTTKKKYKN